MSQDSLAERSFVLASLIFAKQLDDNQTWEGKETLGLMAQKFRHVCSKAVATKLSTTAVVT